MESFNAGSITTDWKVNLSGFKSGLVEAQNLAGKAGGKAGSNFDKGLAKNLKAKATGKKISADLLEGMDPGSLGTTSVKSFRAKFRAGLKGLFKGANIGTVFSGIGLGLNIATLAYSAITNAAQKAREEQERYRAELEIFNRAVSNNDNYIKESNRLKDIAGNTALSTSEKYFQMTQSAEQLDKALKGLIQREKDDLLKDISGPLQELVAARDALRDENRLLDRHIEFSNPLLPDHKTGLSSRYQRRNENSREIEKLDEQIAPKQAEVDRINEAASAYALQAKASRDYQLEFIDLSQRRANAVERGSQVAVDALDDEIFALRLRNRIGHIDAKNAKDLVAGYLIERQAARAAGRDRQKQFEDEAKEKADALLAEQRLNEARAEARQLLESSRTPLEQYTARLEQLAKIQSDNRLKAGDTGGDQTFQRQRVLALVNYARTTKDASIVFAEFERLQKEGLITTAQATEAQRKLEKALGVTADREKIAIELKKQELFLIERLSERNILLARLANDETELKKLERKRDLLERIDDLVNKGGVDPKKAEDQANREIAEEDVARARGVFRSGFSDGLRAAIEGDLGSFLEQKLQDLAANMFDRAVKNLADAVFDQLAQIAPGFLGQITGNTNLAQSLNAPGVATAAASTVASQAAGAGTQAAGTAGAATALTTAMTTGGTTAGATIATAMTTGGTTSSASLTAAMAAGGTAAGTAIGTSMTVAGTAVAAQIAAAMALQGGDPSRDQLLSQLKGLKFGGGFAKGGVIGTGHFGLVGENGPELVSAGSGPIRITPLDGGLTERYKGISTRGLESRGSNQQSASNITMNIAGVKDLSSFVKSQGTIEADMAAAMRRAQADF